MTHLCLSKHTIIGSENGLSLDRRQALSEPMLPFCQLDPKEDISVEILFKIQKFSFVKIRAQTPPNFCDRLIAGGSESIIELDLRFLLSKIPNRNGSEINLIDLLADIRQVSHHIVT